MRERLKRICIAISQKQVKFLKYASEETGLSQSDIVRRSIDMWKSKYLKERKLDRE